MHVLVRGRCLLNRKNTIDDRNKVTFCNALDQPLHLFKDDVLT